MPFLPSLPANTVLMDVFRRFPEFASPLIELHQPILHGPSPLTPGQRELIAAYVSVLNECRYCHGVHSRVAERFGIAPAVLEALMVDAETAPVEERLRPILRFARKLTLECSKVTQADADAILAAGWPEAALAHTVLVVGVFAMMNRIVFGLGIEGDADYFIKAADRLHGNGYTAFLTCLEKRHEKSTFHHGRVGIGSV